MKRCIAMLIVASIGSACAAAPPPSAAPKPSASTVEVYKSLGRKQCEAGGETLETLRAQLQRAGVVPRAASCGTDGRMRAAMCGMGTGDIGIFTVRKADAVRATKAGFLPLTDLRDAERTPCPSETPEQTKR